MELNIKKNAFDYCSYLLILTVPFSTAVPNLILIILSILFLKDVYVQRKFNIEWRPLGLLVLLFLYLFLKAVIFGSYVLDYKIYNGYLLIVWLLVVLQNIKNTERLKFVLLIMATAATLFSLILIGNYYAHTHIMPFGNGARTTNTVLALERPYAGITAVFGFFISISFIKVFPKYKWWFIVNAVLMVSFIILISARLSLLTIFFIGIVFLLFYYRINVYKKTGLLLIFLSVVASLLFFNNNISKRFFITENIDKSIAAAADLEPRVVIWDCAYQMSNESGFNRLIGFESYHNITKKYLACYSSKIAKESKREYYLDENFNSHNQIIDFYLIGGMVAVILFAVFLLNFFYKIRNNAAALALLTAFVFFFILENVFYRQYGCFLFAIFATIYGKVKMQKAK